MPKISVEDLKKIKERECSKMALRLGRYRAKIMVHLGTCGFDAGARDLMNGFRTLIAERKATDVALIGSGCADRCTEEPMVTVQLTDNPPVQYALLNQEKIARIFEEHVIGGKPVTEYILSPKNETAAQE